MPSREPKLSVSPGCKAVPRHDPLQLPTPAEVISKTKLSSLPGGSKTHFFATQHLWRPSGQPRLLP